MKILVIKLLQLRIIIVGDVFDRGTTFIPFKFNLDQKVDISSKLMVEREFR